ncbi:MAG: hypothetical protein ABI478_10765, partial [Propionivibrio sp.]
TQVDQRRNIFRLAGILVLAIATVWLALDLSGMMDIITARGDSYRLEIWSGYFSSTLKCGFMTGCGWGNDLNFIASDGAAIDHPHSMYVQHFYWGGLIGILLLLACITPPLIKGIKLSIYAAWPLLAGSVALAFDGKSLISMPNERWLLVLVPLVIVIGQIDQSSRRQNSGGRSA